MRWVAGFSVAVGFSVSVGRSSLSVVRCAGSLDRCVSTGAGVSVGGNPRVDDETVEPGAPVVDGNFGGCGGVVDLAGSAGRGGVRAGVGDGDPRLLVDVADDLGGAADDTQSAGVGGGELETVEKRVGLLRSNAAGGERVDDTGNG